MVFLSSWSNWSTSLTERHALVMSTCLSLWLRLREDFLVLLSLLEPDANEVEECTGFVQKLPCFPSFLVFAHSSLWLGEWDLVWSEVCCDITSCHKTNNISQHVVVTSEKWRKKNFREKKTYRTSEHAFSFFRSMYSSRPKEFESAIKNKKCQYFFSLVRPISCCVDEKMKNVFHRHTFFVISTTNPLCRVITASLRRHYGIITASFPTKEWDEV